jgi:hypothetical protein
MSGLKEQLQAKLGLAASDAWLQQCVAFLSAQDPGFHGYDAMRQMALVLSQVLPSDLRAASDGTLPLDLQVGSGRGAGLLAMARCDD